MNKSALLFGAVFVLYLLSFFVLKAIDQKFPLDSYPEYTFPIQDSDSLVYPILAENMLKNSVFSSDLSPPLKPDTIRTPGYPLFLVAVKLFFGRYDVAPIFQSLLTFLSGLCVFAIGKKLFSNGVGLAASLLYLLDPTTLWHSITIMSDNFFVFPIVLASFLLFFSKNKHKFYVPLFSGIVLGFAVLVRPIGMFLPVIFVLFFVLCQRFQSHWKKIMVGVLLFINGYTLTITPWILRNKKVAGVASLSGIGAHQLVKFNMPMFISAKENISIDDSRQYLQKYGMDQPYCYLENVSQCNQIFISFLKDYPIAYPLFHITSALPMFLTSGVKTLIYSIPPLEETLKKSDWLSDRGTQLMTSLIYQGKLRQAFQRYQNKMGFLFLIEYLFWAAILCFAILSLFYIQRENRTGEEKLQVVLLFILAIYFAILAAPITAPRYRLPSEPFLFLLASSGLRIALTTVRRLFLGVRRIVFTSAA